MKSVPIIKVFLLPVLVLLMAMSSSVGEGQENKERLGLLEQQRMLTKRIDELRRRQEYLLFLKTVSSTDSKYLVLSLPSRTGQLKYKNRVLRDFRFAAGSSRTTLEQGAATLTKKKEFAGGRKEMIFGDAFLIQRKGLELRRNPSIPCFSFGKKDFKAVFSALEEGARVYVLR